MADSEELTLEDYKILGIDPPEDLVKGEAELKSEEEEEEEESQVSDSDVKLKLLKDLGEDKYYELYPDEDSRKKEEEEEEEEEDLSLGVKIPDIIIQDGEHKGKSLKEVHDEDPFTASVLYQNHLADQKALSDTKIKDDKEEQDSIVASIDVFAESVAGEKYGKKYGSLDNGQMKEVEKVIDQTIAWMTETGRGGNVSDAYLLMNADSRIKDAREKGAKDTETFMAQDIVPSLSPRGEQEGSGNQFERFENMSPAEASVAIDHMTDDQYQKFLKEAPPSTRNKFPAFPWR